MRFLDYLAFQPARPPAIVPVRGQCILTDIRPVSVFVAPRSVDTGVAIAPLSTEVYLCVAYVSG